MAGSSEHLTGTAAEDGEGQGRSRGPAPVEEVPAGPLAPREGPPSRDPTRQLARVGQSHPTRVAAPEGGMRNLEPPFQFDLSALLQKARRTFQKRVEGSRSACPS